MSNRLQKIVLGMLFMLCSMITTQLYSETATATATDEELVVARQIIPSSAHPPTSVAPSASAEVQHPTIANDMAQGQTQRDLPSLNQPLIDQAKLLSPTEYQAISQNVLKLYQEAKAQLGIIIVPTTGQEPIFDYSMRVAEQWKLGSEKGDNGLLMVIAVNDRRIQILTGHGLEGVIPDIVAHRIIRDHITPYFKDAAYAQGIQAGVSEIERILNLDPEIAAQAAAELQAREAGTEEGSNLVFVLLVILGVGALASYVIGNGLSAVITAVVTTLVGMSYGLSLIASILLGIVFFILLVTTIAQTILRLVSQSGGGGGGSDGGGYSGGSSGYSGGGGSFGGGGASGSW